MGSFFEPGTAPGPPEARASVSHGGRSEGRAALRRSKRNRPWNHVVFRPCSTRAGLLTLSAAPKIAGRSRLGRAVKRAIFVRFRQAALRLGRRKRRQAGFVISLGTSSRSFNGKSKFPLFTTCGWSCSARPQETLYQRFLNLRATDP